MPTGGAGWGRTTSSHRYARIFESGTGQLLSRTGLSCGAAVWPALVTTGQEAASGSDLPIHVIDTWGEPDDGLLLIPRVSTSSARMYGKPGSQRKDFGDIVNSSSSGKKVNRGKEFVKALRVRRPLSALQELVGEYRPHMDRQAVTALASHLADRCSWQSSESVSDGNDCSVSGAAYDDRVQIRSFMRSEWMPLFRGHIFAMDAAGLCICVQSVAKVASSSASAADLGTQAEAGGDEGRAWACSTVSAGRWISSVMDEGDAEAVMQAADAVLHSFASRSAVQLLWGLVTQGFQIPSAWLARFLVCTLPGSALHRASPQDLSMLLWCLATHRRQCSGSLPRTWTCRLLDAVAARMPAFGARQLSMALWALAAMRLNPGDSLLSLAVKRAAELLKVSGKAEEHSPSLSDAPSLLRGCASDSDALISLACGTWASSGSSGHSSGSSGHPQLCRESCSSSGVIKQLIQADLGRLSSLPRKCGIHGDPVAVGTPPLSSLEGDVRSYTEDLSAGIDILRPSSRLWDLSGCQAYGTPIKDEPEAASVGLGSRLPTSQQQAGRTQSPGSFFTAASLAQLCYALCILNHCSGPALGAIVMAAMLHPQSSLARTGEPSAVRLPESSRESTVPVPSAKPLILLETMGEREVMLLLMGLAHWKCRPDPSGAWQYEMLRHIHSLMTASSPGGHGRNSLSFSSMAGILWGLAQLGVQPPIGWMHEAENCLISAMDNSSEINGRWSHPQANMSQPHAGWADRHKSHHSGGLQDPAEHKMSSLTMDPNMTARCLAAFGSMRYCPGRALGSRLIAALCRQMSATPAKRLFPALLAVATLDLPVSPRQVRTVLLGPSVLGKYDHCHLGNLLQHAQAVAIWRRSGMCPEPEAERCMQSLLRAASDGSARQQLHDLLTNS